MRILVCIKQVPGTNQVEVDPVTGVLKRSGVKSKLNPYDLYALEAALTLSEEVGGEVEVITMGPPQAKEVVLEAVSMGVKCGTVISDRLFAGADVLATAYTLYQGIRALGEFDLILCGKQTTDGDTAQVGAELAEYLSLPNLSNALTLKAGEDKELLVTASLDEKIVALSVETPCLISMDGDVNSPRLPSYKIRRSLKEDVVRFLSFADMTDQDESHYGLKGSATQVERIFPPEKKKERSVLQGDAEAQASGLYHIILDQKLV